MKKTLILCECVIQDLMSWCRSNSVPVLWVYRLRGQHIYRGSRVICNVLGDASSDAGAYSVLIRDSDYEILRLRLGRLAIVG